LPLPVPDDFDGLGSSHPGVVVFGFRNGSVRFLNDYMELDKLQALLDGTATALP
jgi:hypothetical protein